MMIFGYFRRPGFQIGGMGLLIGGLDFKLAAWVSDQWLGWWVWWPLLAQTGLMVCVCVALLMVCVCVCVWLC